MQTPPTDTPPVRYTLTLADHGALADVISDRQYRQLSCLVAYLYPVFCVSVAAFVVLFTLRQYYLFHYNIDWVSMLSVTCLCLSMTFNWGVGRTINRWTAQWQGRRRPHFGTEVAAWLERDGVHTYTIKTQSHSLVQWAKIVSIAESKGHFFLFLDKRRAITIPKRVFDSLEAQQNFIDFAQNSWLEAHPSEKVAPIAMP